MNNHGDEKDMQHELKCLERMACMNMNVNVFSLTTMNGGRYGDMDII